MPQKARTMDRMVVTMEPLAHETRVLVMQGRDERMRAVLGPMTSSHPRAAATLLEGLALWHQQALSVVLCADVEASLSATRMIDGLGFGVRSVHYEVEVALRAHREQSRRFRGFGNFAHLRQLCLEGVSP